MRQYELTYLVSDTVPESDLNRITGAVAGFIAEDGGKLLKEEVWKRRKLAYPIKKQEFATYVSANIELPALKTNSFERQIRLTREIIRHLLVLKEKGPEALTLTQDEIVGAEDIEAAIGGERSFEVVEGETEESRDLMAVRENDETTEDDKTEELKNERAKEQEEEEIEKAADVEAEEPKEDEQDEEEVKETEEQEEVKEESVKEEVVETPRRQGSAGQEKPRAKKAKTENEADRLAKLDEELDSILKDEL